MSHPHPRVLTVACVLLFAAAGAPHADDLTPEDVALRVRLGLPADLPQEKADRLLLERAPIEVGLPGRPEVPPRVHALSCGSPSVAGTLQASHPYYDVFLDAAGGAFSARTGVSHSVTLASFGAPQNVIYGGSTGSTGTSDVSWRFHVQGITYQSPVGGGSACVFDPPDTPMEPNSVGIEQEFTQSPEPGVTVTLRQEIVAFGTTEDDSGVRLTLSTTNWASSTTNVMVGVRWQIDYQNAFDDGPLYAPVTCTDPPVVGRELSTEHEFAPAEIQDFYRIQNNTSAPIFSNVTSTTAISGIPNTGRPDRLVYGRWGAMRASPWDYTTIEGAAGPDGDSAVLWYHGYLPADADVLGPGQTSRHSIVIFSSPDRVDCGSFVPTCASNIAYAPAGATICEGQTAPLDAGGITLTDCAGSVLYTWTDGTSSWSGPSQVVSPADTTRYDVAVTCSTDPACRVDASATITVDKAPLFEPPITWDPDPCNNGIKLTWNDARFRGATGDGAYNVYRSDVSCADALLQPPLARGLRGTSYNDLSVAPRTTYYYVVEAEDLSGPTACSPQGPSGGAVTRLCAPPMADSVDTDLPAGAGTVLFLTHDGDEVTLRWPTLRPLQPGEHPHVRKAWLDPVSSWLRVGPVPDGSLATTYTETDTSARLQFFDLRVANACERESLADYPPFSN